MGNQAGLGNARTRGRIVLVLCFKYERVRCRIDKAIYNRLRAVWFFRPSDREKSFVILLFSC